MNIKVFKIALGCDSLPSIFKCKNCNGKKYTIVIISNFDIPFIDGFIP